MKSAQSIDTQQQIDAAERILRLAWVIVFGAVLFSVLTVTPLVQRVTPDGWELTAPILPIVVDAAVVIVVRVDAIVARLDGRAGFWPALLRWLTGIMTLALNVGDSMLKGDWVGVGVHAVAPTLLIVTAEASLMWRRAITTAVARIEGERAAEVERERREREEREKRSRAEREDARRAAEAERERIRSAEERAREQEAADREREREHAARLAREEREHEARIERERAEREDARKAAERAEIARQQRAEQERVERERREAQERAARERAAANAIVHRPSPTPASTPRPTVSAAVSTPRPAVSTSRPTVSATVSTPAHESAHATPATPATQKRMGEAAARKAVADAVREGRSQREIAALTGWSTGWVAKRCQELASKDSAAA